MTLTKDLYLSVFFILYLQLAGLCQTDTEKTSSSQNPSFNSSLNMNTSCSLKFFNIQNKEEIKHIESTIRKFAEKDLVQVISGRDGQEEFTEFTFNIKDIKNIEALQNSLPYKHKADGQKELIYQEFSRNYSSNFRTVTIKASMNILLNFKVTPGAELYYSSQQKEELRVNEGDIDSTGNVTLETAISKEQKYIFARTKLGKVERYLRINIETKKAEEIDKKHYYEWLNLGKNTAREPIRNFDYTPVSIVDIK